METLALNGCKIKSLAHFPNTPKLVRVRIIRALLNVRIVQLELAENEIKSADLTHLKHLVKLETLKLGNNQINTVKSLEAIVSALKYSVLLITSDTLEMFGLSEKHRSDGKRRYPRR